MRIHVERNQANIAVLIHQDYLEVKIGSRQTVKNLFSNMLTEYSLILLMIRFALILKLLLIELELFRILIEALIKVEVTPD